MSRLSPENKALIRAALNDHAKDTALVAFAGILFFPLLFLLGGVKKTTAKKFDLGPRSTRIFERVLADQEKRSKREAKKAA